MDWKALSPAQVLDTHVALTISQSAFVLGLCHQKGQRKGEPNRRLVLDLIAAGRLELIDPEQPITRWTISARTLRAYMGDDRLVEQVKAS